MILARRIFIVGIGYLEGAQEVPDLSLAVADREWSRVGRRP